MQTGYSKAGQIYSGFLHSIDIVAVPRISHREDFASSGDGLFFHQLGSVLGVEYRVCDFCRPHLISQAFVPK